MNKVQQFWSDLRASFWFLPSVIVAVSIALAAALVDTIESPHDLGRFENRLARVRQALELEPVLLAVAK